MTPRIAFAILATLLSACGNGGNHTARNDADVGPSESGTTNGDGDFADATIPGHGGSDAMEANGSAGTGGSAAAGGSADDAGTEGDAGPSLDADCRALVSNPNVNWRDSALQTDQEIVACLAESLGRPVGYGEKARGGYDPHGGSKLTVIRKNEETSVEAQVAQAIRGDEHTWIVFDKNDFADPHEVALYRLQCEEASLHEALGVSGRDACMNYRGWCEGQGISDDDCLPTFFNDRLDDGDLPIGNIPVGSNTTLDGRHSQAYFLFNGFAIGSDEDGEPEETKRSVILTDLRFQGAGHTEDHALDPDMIRATGASHDIWIHHNTFDLTGDSAFDVKVGAYDVTVSSNRLRNVKRAALHGSSDSREINAQITTTLHHNAFITTDAYYDTFANIGRRVPLIRRGTSHMFNNLFYNYRKDVLSVRVGARVAFEDNMFLANRTVAGDDDLDYFVDNLLRDYREGGLEVTGSHVWLSDAACMLDASTSGDLTASHGSPPSPLDDYSQASRATIDAHRVGAGQQLADYVLATAGKGGARPFNSPYAPARSELLEEPRPSCQE